ncbi:MAG: mannose-1-phosphate guanyltransferase [Ignavibacteriae bacterium]|nr:mannose-1-phosphate guanyltransferase [Ignavibacteriota bacterium]
MKAVILAGGLGSRLKPFTEVIPKPLLPVGKKAVLEVQIERLKSYGFDEVYLATNYKSEYIENFFGNGNKYGIQLFISKEEKPLGTAGPLKLLSDEFDEPFLVMNGDILTLMNFKKFYEYAVKKQTLLTIAIKKIITPYDFGNIYFTGDYVTNITEKPDIITYALAGIYIMRPEILHLIPNKTYYGMDYLIRDLLAKQIPISKYELKEYWLDIGKPEDYEKAQHDYFSQLAEVQ